MPSARSSPPELQIVGLGGSLAERSTSRAALGTALEGAAGAEHGPAATRLFDVREMDLPMYDPASTGTPDAAEALADAAREAHGMIWSSPLYHGTVSGAFKNALDWLQLLGRDDPPYLSNTVIGLVSVAGGVQGLQAVNTMEFAVRALRGWAVPLVVPVSRAYEAFDAEGRPTDPSVGKQLRGLGAEVVRAARQFTRSGTCDYVSETVSVE
jgi:FMN reductase